MNNEIKPHQPPFMQKNEPELIQEKPSSPIEKEDKPISSSKEASCSLIKTISNKKIILKNFQSPGDILMLTAGVRDLKLSNPNLKIDVRTSASEIWDNNPHLTPLNEKDEDVTIFNIDYPAIHNSNNGPWHFVHGFRLELEKQLKTKIKATQFKGDIHISNEEKMWMSQIEEMEIKDKFWIIISGGKYDFSAKWGNPLYFQEVIDYFKNKVTFVQCGQSDHWHPKLNNVIDLVGKTNLRQFIRLIYHSVGILCPITFAMHAAVAIESKHGLINRPCVVVAGGREPSQWEKYPHHRFLETNGCLDCCNNGGCWRSRCQKVGDGDKKDTEHLCLHPTEIDFDFNNDKIKDEKLKIAKCINMIKPKDIIRAIEMYYDGGILKYNE